ncbi:hypothetical protein FA95DRAFT_1613103 [Auriscalpium vulgare]|uniref:Uncharacterized protein n=1 Tax=Auriscalpium vulgare TaxID=40419 RepID=A0ACB8R591_9AGAM|nr:hypothetical protein FA95DRAFT_1613103 [Auriscalpium vulgare]
MLSHNLRFVLATATAAVVWLINPPPFVAEDDVPSIFVNGEPWFPVELEDDDDDLPSIFVNGEPWFPVEDDDDDDYDGEDVLSTGWPGGHSLDGQVSGAGTTAAWEARWGVSFWDLFNVFSVFDRDPR